MITTMTTETSATPDAPSTFALPRRFLRTFLLLALDRDGTSHGYELFECVAARGLVVDMAGVYRDLRAMEQHDLVTSDWEPSDSGPDRRVYDLTDAGRVAAAGAADELATIRDGLTAALLDFTVAADQPVMHLGAS
jgi:DNA-binding PadR family transcriptional regulator